MKPGKFRRFFCHKKVDLMALFCYNFFAKKSDLCGRLSEAYTNNIKIVYPTYFENFTCKASACRHVCCNGWRVSLSNSEYLRLSRLNCSKELRKKIDSALIIYERPEPDRYAYLASNENGSCLLLDLDGLCSLQRECGADVIASVCRMYPRTVHVGGAAEPVCSGSCEAVIEHLIADTSPIEFRMTYREVESTPPSIHSNEDQIRLRIKCIEEIQNSAEDITSRVLALGRSLLGDEPPLMTHDHAAYLTAAYDLIHNLSPFAPALAEWGEEALRILGVTDRNAINDEVCNRFEKFQHRIKSNIPEIDTYFGKIFANHMYYEQFPYTVDCRNTREAYVSFCATFVLVTFISVCCFDCDRPIESFVDSVAAVFRTVEHSAFYKNANIVLKAEGDV